MLIEAIIIYQLDCKNVTLVGAQVYLSSSAGENVRVQEKKWYYQSEQVISAVSKSLPPPYHDRQARMIVTNTPLKYCYST